MSRAREDVVALLTEYGEMYGLDMVHRSRHLRRGTIYVLLNAMEDEQIIVSRLEAESEAGGKPRRRKYKLWGIQDAIDRSIAARNK